MKIAIADANEAALAQLGKELIAVVGEGNVLVVPTDVSKLEQVQALSKRVYDAWGEVRICATSEVHRRASGAFVLLYPTYPFPLPTTYANAYSFPRIIFSSIPSRQ